MKNRKRVYTIVCLMPIVLVGLFLACDFGSPDADGETLPASTASISQVLTRTFALPIPLFASNSAWNQTATGASVLSASDQQITVTYRVLLGDTTDLHPSGPPPTTWPFPDVNYDEYAVPVFRAGAGEQSVHLCDYEGYESWPSPKFPEAPQQEGGPVTVPAPTGTVRPAGPQGIEADGHLVLYDAATPTEYDFWQASTVITTECESWGGGFTGTAILEAGAIDFFDVRGSGMNPNGYSSARAVGTPLLAGLILPEDVESGAISHALAFAIPGLRNMNTADPYEPFSSDYFYPAATTEGDFYSTNSDALAAGQRIRLKSAIVDEACSQINESQLAPITQMFLTALRTYGAYLVDNAGGFTFYAEDIHSANLNLTDAQVKYLIDDESSLPQGKTKWQIVIEKLNEELEGIPFACGENTADPPNATVTIANFEVVEPATFPVTFTVVSTTYLPLVLDNFSSPSALAEPMSLDDVTYWAYQIQAISTTGTLDGLVASHYDMLVLEPTRTDWSSGDKNFDTQGMVTQLKNSTASDGEHHKLVLAYVDIGEAEDWRWYWTWSQDWNCEGDPPANWPDYILACDPDGWAGNYPVAYWDPLWKDIVITGANQNSDPYGNYNSIIDEVIKDGFDGIYLDWVEAFECSEVITAAQAAGKDPANEMIKFIQEMRDYAAARNPDFIIIQQNAASLIDGHPELTGVIDAIAQEAIWYDGSADVDWDNPLGYDQSPAEAPAGVISYLDQYLSGGLPVFDCEYALEYAATAYANACSKGYAPYATRRALSQLTTTPFTGCTSTSTTLAAVNDFLYQLQNLNLTNVGETAYDLVVMDYSADGDDETAFTTAQIAALKDSPGGAKIVLAYMSIGEAEDYRFYWQSGWTPGNPAWLDVVNPDWAGNYKVRYWDSAWQTIIFSYTDRLLDAGFDGAYLDIIDAYEYYSETRPTAAQDMAAFVAAIRAHARASDPDFYIFPQNAPELADEVTGYLNSVDGIGQEDIYYGYDDDDVMTPEGVTAELEGYLDLFKNAGKLVLTVDYAIILDHVDDAYTKSQANKGYVPFVTVRDLNQLIINEGHEPD